MKKIRILSVVLALLTAVSMLPAVTLFSTAEVVASGDCGDNLTWELDDAGTLTISGRGLMNNFSEYGSPWNSVKNSIRNVVLGSRVASIGNFAFTNCSSLTSILISDSVSSIGSHAFTGCSNLLSVGIPDSVETIGTYAFFNCSKLKTVTIGNHVKSIGQNAFRNCASLTEIDIPDSVSTVGIEVFHGCGRLQRASVGNGVSVISNSMFSECGALESITLGNSITSIDSCAFKECTALQSIVIPDSILTIGTYAFQYCTSLSSVTFGTGLKSIGDSAFAYCTSLSSLSIPGNVEVISGGAFKSCTNLSGLLIEDGVTYIGSSAFSECGKLKSIFIPKSVGTIYYGAFQYCSSLLDIFCEAPEKPGGWIDGIYTTPWNANCPAAVHWGYIPGTTIVVASGECGDRLNWELDSEGRLFILGSGEMRDYGVNNAPWYGRRSQVKEVYLLDGVTKIGKCAFYDCAALTSVIIPAGVESIGSEAFCGCAVLDTVGIPASVESIGAYAFDDCAALADISYEAAERPVGWDAEWLGNCAAAVQTGVTIPEAVCHEATWICEGTVLYHQTYLDGDEIPPYMGTLPTKIADEAFTYSFDGWSGVTDENGNVTYTPAFAAEAIPTVTVSWIVDGETVQTVTIKLDQTVPAYAGETPVREADEEYEYYFGGWDKSADEDGNILFTAWFYSAPLNVFANGYLGGLYWELDEDGLLTISGYDMMYDFTYGDYVEWKYYCNNIKKVVIEEGVYTIGAFAFEGCRYIESIKLPMTIEYIGEGAFYNCGAELVWGSAGDYAVGDINCDGVVSIADVTELLLILSGRHSTVSAILSTKFD